MKKIISSVADRYLSPKRLAAAWISKTARNLGLSQIPLISDEAHRLAYTLLSGGVEDKEVAYGVAWTLQKRYGKVKDPDLLNTTVAKFAGDYSNSIAWGHTEICQKIASDWARIAGKDYLPGHGSKPPSSSSPSSGGGGGMNNVRGCFAKGTSILMSDGSSKPIEEVKVGDTVVSYDLDKGSIVSEGVVTHLSKQHWREDWKTLSFDDLKNTNTECHPYWTRERGWASLNPEKTAKFHKVTAALLKIGDHCLKLDGRDESWVRLQAVEDADPQFTYNLDRVAPNHVYFANGILVHNKKFSELELEDDSEEGDETLAWEAIDPNSVMAEEFMPNSVDLTLDLLENNKSANTTNFEKSAHLAYKIAKGMGETEESSLCAAIFSAQATLKLETVKDLI
jgi:hypothetical protein